VLELLVVGLALIILGRASLLTRPVYYPLAVLLGLRH